MLLTSCDAHTSVEVVDNGKDCGVEVERHPVGRDEAHDGNNDNECSVQPVDMLVPVGPCNWSVCDMNLLGLGLALCTKRLVVGRAIREDLSLCELGGGSRHRRGGETTLPEIRIRFEVGMVMELDKDWTYDQEIDEERLGDLCAGSRTNEKEKTTRIESEVKSQLLITGSMAEQQLAEKCWTRASCLVVG